MKRRKSTLHIGNYKTLYGDSGIKPTYTHTAAGKFKSCLSMLISCYKEDRYPWAYQSHHHHQSLRTTSKEIPRKSIWEDVWHWCLFIGFEIQHTLIAFAICDTAKSVFFFTLCVLLFPLLESISRRIVRTHRACVWWFRKSRIHLLWSTQGKQVNQPTS